MTGLILALSCRACRPYAPFAELVRLSRVNVADEMRHCCCGLKLQLAYRTIGIYVFLRTVTCSPVRANQVAHALKLPRVAGARARRWVLR